MNYYIVMGGNLGNVFYCVYQSKHQTIAAHLGVGSISLRCSFGVSFLYKISALGSEFDVFLRSICLCGGILALLVMPIFVFNFILV